MVEVMLALVRGSSWHAAILPRYNRGVEPLAKGTRVSRISDGAHGTVKMAIGPTTEESPEPGRFVYRVDLDAGGASVILADSSLRPLA
jgi:hypothetical protein